MTTYLFLICAMAYITYGFLIDDKTRTPITTPSTYSEEHFAIVMNLLMEEKQSRIKLENRFLQLENELLATQKGLTDMYHAQISQNETSYQQTTDAELLNKNVSSLKDQYNILFTRIDEIQLNQTLFENRTVQIEQILESLKHVKGISDMKLVLDIGNQTTNLAAELQKTRFELSTIQSHANARKQDFLALYNKADITEQSLNAEIYKNENRVAVTSCTTENTYQTKQVIPFKNIVTVQGISQTGKDEIRRTGKFTCELPGLYLISVFVMTPINGAVAIIYKNEQIIAYDYFSMNAHFQTNTITMLQNMTINDTIYIKANENMYVYGEQRSCMTILQID